MMLATELLEQALMLARKERKRPKQASLRRAVSTAYYSLFHLLTFEACRLIGDNIDVNKRLRMARWLDHKEMRLVCGMFSASEVPKDFSSLLDVTPSPSLAFVAQTFVTMQHARHDADYDLTKSFTRIEVLQRVESVRSATVSWGEIRNSHEASVFALALVGRKLFDKEHAR